MFGVIRVRVSSYHRRKPRVLVRENMGTQLTIKHVKRLRNYRLIGRLAARCLVDYVEAYSRVILSGNNGERRNHLALRVDSSNHCNQFPVPRFDCSRARTSVRACNDYVYRHNFHHKASLVKFVNIRMEDAVLGNHIL